LYSASLGIGAFEVIEIPSSTSFAILGATVATGTGSGGGAAVSAALEIDAGSATFSSARLSLIRFGCGHKTTTKRTY
jgi:hypothetical protein